MGCPEALFLISCCEDLGRFLFLASAGETDTTKSLGGRARIKLSRRLASTTRAKCCTNQVSKTDVNKYTNRSTNISCACYGGIPGGNKGGYPEGITSKDCFSRSAVCPRGAGLEAESNEVDGWSYSRQKITTQQPR